jgi:hypothetical protein
VRTAFVQNAETSLAEALAAAGQCQVVIVPLLLSAGYHLSQDIGEAAARAGVPVAAPLGPGPGLVPALADRLRAAGTPVGTPVVLAAAGSTDPRAAGEARNQAALLAAHLQAPALAAFASAARPAVGEAVADLAAHTEGPWPWPVTCWPRASSTTGSARAGPRGSAPPSATTPPWPAWSWSASAPPVAQPDPQVAGRDSRWRPGHDV